MTFRQMLGSLFLSSLVLACAPERVRRGDIDLVYGLTGQQRALFEVEQGRILAQWLDLATESDQPGACVRGTWGQSAVSLCPEPLDPKDSHFGGALTRWSGPQGELAIEVAPNGQAVRVDGSLSRGSGSGHATSDASVHRDSSGGRARNVFAGDENNLGSRASRVWMHITLPLGHGPQWDELRRNPELYAVAAASIGLTQGEGVPPRLQPSPERRGDLGPGPSTPPPSSPPPPPPDSMSAPAPAPSEPAPAEPAPTAAPVSGPKS